MECTKCGRAVVAGHVAEDAERLLEHVLAVRIDVHDVRAAQPRRHPLTARPLCGERVKCASQSSSAMSVMSAFASCPQTEGHLLSGEQGKSWQAPVKEFSPTHGSVRSPYDVMLQWRTRSRVPPPQLVLQPPHDSHACHSPGTAEKYGKGSASLQSQILSFVPSPFADLT